MGPPIESPAPLPEELRVPVPRPLPDWARRPPWLWALPMVCASLLAGMFLAVEGLVPAALLAAGVVVGTAAWLGLWRSRQRQLAHGDAVAAVVIDAFGSCVTCTYATPLGEVRKQVRIDIARARRELGGRPEPGDTLFLVHPPGAPSSPFVWGFASRPRDQVTQLRQPAVLLVGLGLFLNLPAVLLVLKLAAALPLDRVVACELSYSHLYWAHLQLSSGARATVTSGDIERLETCLPSGTQLEKRRWRLAYWVDGVPRPVPKGSWAPQLVLSGAGLVMLVLGALRLRRADHLAKLASGNRR